MPLNSWISDCDSLLSACINVCATLLGNSLLKMIMGTEIEFHLYFMSMGVLPVYVTLPTSCLGRWADFVRSPETGVRERCELLLVLGMKPGCPQKICSVLNCSCIFHPKVSILYHSSCPRQPRSLEGLDSHCALKSSIHLQVRGSA